MDEHHCMDILMDIHRNTGETNEAVAAIKARLDKAEDRLDLLKDRDAAHRVEHARLAGMASVIATIASLFASSVVKVFWPH